MDTSQSFESNKNRFLLNYRSSVTSQYGEDGIIEKIFEIIPKEVQNNWCCEFGAWDGVVFSNTFNLLTNKGWSGVLIEANTLKCDQLKKRYEDKSNIFCLNKFIELEGSNSLDNIFSETPIPNDFDFLSIDIDGFDYHIWKSIQRYKPKVVVVEFNFTIPGNIEFIQSYEPGTRQGTSILSFNKMAIEKGYQLICINHENAFFVREEYFKLFGIENNSIDEIKYYKEPLQVFQLFDGTIVFHGSQRLYWHEMNFNLNKFQVLPKFIRKANIPWQEGTKMEVKMFWRLKRIWEKYSRKNAPVTDPFWKQFHS